MLEDAAGIRKVVLACGYVDLRKGIDGLSRIIGDKYQWNPFEKKIRVIFLLILDIMRILRLLIQRLDWLIFRSL